MTPLMMSKELATHLASLRTRFPLAERETVTRYCRALNYVRARRPVMNNTYKAEQLSAAWNT